MDHFEQVSYENLQNFQGTANFDIFKSFIIHLLGKSLNSYIHTGIRLYFFRFISFSLFRDDVWATCLRDGYFFHGFFTVGRNFLADIGQGQCCKPDSHPDQDGPCRDVDVDFTEDGTEQCPDGFFMKGLYKAKCSTIDCLTQIRCCRMVPGK